MPYDPSKSFVCQLKSIAERTHPHDGPVRVRRLGKRYALVKDYQYWKDFSELSGSDGIGTKGYLHWLADTIPFGVQDAFAMVADDLMESGYVPVHLQDHLMVQEERREKIFLAMESLRDLCTSNKWHANGKEYPIIISGGETAITDTIKGFEMGVTATGYARKGEEIDPWLKPGDAIIGLASSGIHSNGLSFLREELFEKRKLGMDSLLFGTVVGEELTKPTRLYMPALKDFLNHYRGYVHGMVHITGGGLAKLRELRPREADIFIVKTHSLKPQKIFEHAYELGCPSHDMYERFNNGVGFAVAMSSSKAEDALRLLRKYVDSDIIGSSSAGSGKVVIESHYENKLEIYS